MKRSQSSVLKSLGDLYTEQGKFNEALNVPAGVGSGEKQANFPNQLGALNSLSASPQNGEAGKAMKNVQRALKILEGRTDPFWQGESWNNLGYLISVSVNFPRRLQLSSKQWPSIKRSRRG